MSYYQVDASHNAPTQHYFTEGKPAVYLSFKSADTWLCLWQVGRGTGGLSHNTSVVPRGRGTLKPSPPFSSEESRRHCLSYSGECSASEQISLAASAPCSEGHSDTVPRYPPSLRVEAVESTACPGASLWV